MKTLPLLVVAAAALGCGPKSEFDVSPAQVKNQKTVNGPGGGKIDLNHLPPGAVKHEHVFQKGETLPDGSPAHGGEKMVTVERKGPNPGAQDQDITITK